MADGKAKAEAEDRLQEIEDDLRFHRSEMRRVGLAHLPPLPHASLQAVLADKEGSSDGER